MFGFEAFAFYHCEDDTMTEIETTVPTVPTPPAAPAHAATGPGDAAGWKFPHGESVIGLKVAAQVQRLIARTDAPDVTLHLVGPPGPARYARAVAAATAAIGRTVRAARARFADDPAVVRHRGFYPQLREAEARLARATTHLERLRADRRLLEIDPPADLPARVRELDAAVAQAAADRASAQADLDILRPTEAPLRKAAAAEIESAFRMAGILDNKVGELEERYVAACRAIPAALAPLLEELVEAAVALDHYERHYRADLDAARAEDLPKPVSFPPVPPIPAHG